MTESHETAIASTETERAIQAFLRKLALECTIDDDESGMDVAHSIAAKIVTAETEDEIFDAGNASTIAGQDFLNRPFRLTSNGFEVKKSTIEGEKKFPYYLLMHVSEIATGAETVLNCGSYGLVSTIIALRDGGHMEKYDSQGGMPLVITAKATRKNQVLILQKYKTPVNGKAEK